MGNKQFKKSIPKLRKLIEKPKVIESALGPAEVVTDFTDFSASDCPDTEPDSDDDTLPQRTDTPLERRHARLRFLRVDGLFDHHLHGGYSANAAAV
jgi:hypothetical protein